MLTLAQFKTYANYDFTFTSNQDAFVSWVLEGINDQIEAEVGGIFNLTQVDSTSSDPDFKYLDYKGHNMSVVTIGAWQPGNLTVQVGSITDPANLTTCSLNSDYTLIRFYSNMLPGRSNPVTAIRFNGIVTGTTLIRVTGTYGFSNGLPFDLESLLYNAVKSKFNLNNETTENPYTGRVDSLRSETLSESYEVRDEDAGYARKITMNIMAVPVIRSTLNKYKQSFNQVVSIV